MHIVDIQKTPKFARSLSYSSTNAPTRPKVARKATEIDMLDGVVDMDIFNQIVALDEGDLTKEFSKTLVTAWCDQAETSIEEMRSSLSQGNIVDAAHKAHYLKGSSASLGLVKVSKTCQAIYHVHFTPNLASMMRHPSSESSSSSSSSGSFVHSPGGSSRSPSLSPVYEYGDIDFEAVKLERASLLLEALVRQIKQASGWLEIYYRESDKYGASLA